MKKLLGFVFLTIFLLSFTARPVLAQVTTKVLPQQQTISGDYFATGNTVTISGTVHGDVYAAGGNVLIDGTVTGDVLAAGGSVMIRGTVQHNVRIAGGQVTISGSVGGNVSAAAGNVTITNSATIAGSVVTASGNLTASGPIKGNLSFAAGTILVDNAVSGTVWGSAGAVTLSPNARVGKGVRYFSNTLAIIQQGAIVRGAIVQQHLPNKPNANRFSGFAQLLLLFRIGSTIATLIIGILLLKFLPAATESIAHTVEHRFWSSLGLGIIAILVVPIILIILCITVIGIPLAFVFFALYLLYLYIAKFFVYLAVGNALRRYFTYENIYLRFFIGFLILEILKFIPIIGLLITLIVTAVGVGALIRTHYHLVHNENKIMPEA